MAPPMRPPELFPALPKHCQKRQIKPNVSIPNQHTVNESATAEQKPVETAASEPDAEESLAELAELASSAGAQVVGRLMQSRPAIDAATLVGSGEVEEIRSYIDSHQVDTVIFDHELTPTQLRNLERRLPAKIVDRTQLILDIFARRA